MKKIAILSALLLLAPLVAYAQTQVRTVGTASVQKNFVSIARDKAIDNAKRLAVEQASRTFIQNETLVQNYQVVYDRIFSRFAGYINSYRIVDERREGDEYRVTIDAEVETAKLQQDLDSVIKSILPELGNPRLMVLFSQREQKDFLAEGAMVNYFLSKGFKLVDADVVRAHTAAARLKSLDQDKDAAREVGNRYGAEIIIVGSVQTTSHPFKLGDIEMFTNRAVISSKVIKSDTGDIMATGSEEHKLPGVKDNFKEPVEEASRKVSEALLKKIASWWQNELSSTMSVKLVVNGLSSFKEVTAFKERLPQEARGIERMDQRSYGQGRLEMDIELKGKVHFLANDLVNFQMDGRSFVVQSETPNKLVVELR
jgi:hypothetical protein